MDRFTKALLILLLLTSYITLSHSKSTIEPCSGSDTCPALINYSLYADLKVSELGALFQVDPISILSSNSIDVSIPDVANRILPSGLSLNIPVRCSCFNGIRRSVSTTYTTRPSDSLASISGLIFSGLTTPDQIRDANYDEVGNLDQDDTVGVGTKLVVPLPCTCFNNTDNLFPAIYLSYLVEKGDTVPGIARRYMTTVTDVMNVNAMGSDAVKEGDILAIPLPACASKFPSYASDFGLVVANGSYAITADHCVQCSCGPGNLNLYCTPASLSVSCTSMQCKNSNLMLGNVTSQATSAGCNVTSCSYGGFVNGTIATTLSTFLQPQCPGAHQFPAVIPPPTVAMHEALGAPSPSPSPVPVQSGGAASAPMMSVPGGISLPGASPANGPAGSTSAAISCDAGYLNLATFTAVMYLLYVFGV